MNIASWTAPVIHHFSFVRCGRLARGQGKITKQLIHSLMIRKLKIYTKYMLYV